MKCPTCDGNKRICFSLRRGDDPQNEIELERDCPVCGGGGKIGDYVADNGYYLTPNEACAYLAEVEMED